MNVVDLSIWEVVKYCFFLFSFIICLVKKLNLLGYNEFIYKLKEVYFF